MITLIHRADRLDDILARLHGRAGAITVFPLWPRGLNGGGGTAAKRVLVQARKGVKSPMKLAPGLVLHEADGGYTAAASRVLRDGAGLDL